MIIMKIYYIINVYQICIKHGLRSLSYFTSTINITINFLSIFYNV